MVRTYKPVTNFNKRKYLIKRSFNKRQEAMIPLRFQTPKRYKGIQQETKYIDNIPAANGASAGSTIAISTAGTILNWWPIQNGGAFAAGQSLVQFPQGTTKNQRIGNKSFIRHIRGKLIFTVPSGSTDGDVLRVIIYQDRQCNGTAATVADILEYASCSSFQQMDFVDQIKILHDEHITINPQTSTAANSTAIAMLTRCIFSLKINQEVHFNNTTGTLAGIVSNNFNVLVISTTGNSTISGTATGAAGSSFIRTYFKDK